MPDIGPDARGNSLFELVSALSDGHDAMLKAITVAAKTADVGKPDRPNATAIGDLLSWARQTAGPPGLRKNPPDAVAWLMFIVPPWNAIDLRAWATWQQNLQNEFNEYAGSGIGQYTESTFNKFESYRKQFNDWASKFRAAGMKVDDVGERKLAPIAPSVEDVKKAAGEVADAASKAAADAAKAAGGALAPVLIGAAVLGGLYLYATRTRGGDRRRAP